MYKMTETYIDFDGNKRTEDYLFNFTETELAEMEISIEGGMKQMIDNIIAANEEAKLIKLFKELMDKSYGVKSPDGRYFEKDEKELKKFKSTQAYSNIFMKLARNADEAAAFVNGIMPEHRITNTTGLTTE